MALFAKGSFHIHMLGWFMGLEAMAEHLLNDSIQLKGSVNVSKGF